MRGGTARQRRASLSCLLGLAIVVVALVPPLARQADVYLWVRALQALLLVLAGPGLIVAGASRLAYRTGPGTGSVPLTVRWPVAATILANALWLAWQLPALVELARTSAVVALAEHACYLAAGLLLWRQLIPAAAGPVPSPLRRMALLIGSVGVFTIAGMALVFGSGVVYPGYAGAAHHVMTVLDDQQLSGAVLWMGSLPPFIVAGMALVLQWLSNEESAELSAGFDRLLTPRRTGWPSRPVIR